MSRIVESLERIAINESILNEELVPDEFNTIEELMKYVAKSLKCDSYTIENFGHIDEFPYEISYKVNGKEGSIRISDYYDDIVMTAEYDTNSKDPFILNSYNNSSYFDVKRWSSCRGNYNMVKLNSKQDIDSAIASFNHFIMSKSKNNFGSGEGLAKKFSMTDKDTEYYGLHGSYARYTMAVADGFKYNDDCEYDKEITSILKKVFKKMQFPAINNTSNIAKVNKVWRLNSNPRILLVSTTGYHFLTPEETLYEDTKKLIDQIKSKDEISESLNNKLNESNSNMLNNSEQEIVDMFVSIMKDYVDEFYSKVTTRCKIPGKGISARFSTERRPAHRGSSFYMDYSCVYPSYSKETAKLALDIFNNYASIIISYLEILKSRYENLQYEVGKTIVSSSRVGKGVYVYDFPFDLPDMYYEDGKIEKF